MRYILPFYFLLLADYGNSQIELGFSYNIDLYKPYTEEAQNYMALNDNVRSSTFETSLSYGLSISKKHKIYLGISHKFIYLRIKEIVQSYKKPIDVGQFIEQPGKYDLINQSNSLGIKLAYKYCFNRKEKLFGEMEIKSTIYFVEFYKEYLKLVELYGDFEGDGAPQLSFHGVPVFFLSSANLSIGYKQFLIQKEKFNLGAKVSVGTNLYSDWDLFRKYVWIGVGLEMGFGKGRALFGNKEKK